MGEIAEPTEQERRETWDLADEIVEAVRQDECGPCDLPFELRHITTKKVDEWTAENEERIFRLAHELTLLREEANAYRGGLEKAIEYLDDADRSGDWKDELAELRAMLKEPLAEGEPCYLVIWRDRRTDIRISPTTSLIDANALLEEHMEMNRDEDFPWIERDYGKNQGWERYVSTDCDDLPSGYIEKSTIRRSVG